MHHFTLTPTVHKGYNFLQPPQHLLFSVFFDNTYPNECEVVPHSCFDFPNNEPYLFFFNYEFSIIVQWKPLFLSDLELNLLITLEALKPPNFLYCKVAFPTEIQCEPHI